MLGMIWEHSRDESPKTLSCTELTNKLTAIKKRTKKQKCTQKLIKRSLLKKQNRTQNATPTPKPRNRLQRSPVTGVLLIVYAEHCARLWYIIQHRVVLIPPLLQAVIIVQMLPIGEAWGRRQSLCCSRTWPACFTVSRPYNNCLYSASENVAGNR